MPSDTASRFGHPRAGPSPAPPLRVRSTFIEREAKQLPGPSGKTRTGTFVHGGSAVLLGIAALAIALLFPVIAFTDDLNPGTLQFLFVCSMSLMFGLAGVSFISHGLKGASRRRRATTEEFWIGDHRWDTRRSSFHAVGEGSRLLFTGLVFAVFLTPFNLWAWGSRGIVLVGIVLLFDAGTVACLCKALYLYGRGWKYGTSHLWFDRFPFVPGEPLEVRFRSKRTIHSRGIVVTLRAVEEFYETTYSATGHRRTRIVRYQKYAEVRHVRPAPISQGGTAFDIAFDLPADGPSSEVSGTPATYWELEVTAENPGIDFRAIFLVPVYSRDATAYTERQGRLIRKPAPANTWMGADPSDSVPRSPGGEVGK